MWFTLLPQGLSSPDADPEKSSTAAASLPDNREKNRYRDALSCTLSSPVPPVLCGFSLITSLADDHSRVKLSPEDASGSDYINASFIVSDRLALSSFYLLLVSLQLIEECKLYRANAGCLGNKFSSRVVHSKLYFIFTVVTGK